MRGRHPFRHRERLQRCTRSSGLISSLNKTHLQTPGVGLGNPVWMNSRAGRCPARDVQSLWWRALQDGRRRAGEI